MTRTENLNLCRWTPNDFVDVAEVNENFTILDKNVGHNNHCGDAAGINLAGLLLQDHHAGKDVSFAQRVLLCDATATGDLGAYGSVYVPAGGARILSASYSGETRSLSPTVGVRPDKTMLVLTFTPANFAALTSVKFTFNSNIGSGGVDYITFFVDGEKVAESEHISIGSGSTTETIPVSLALDPNKTYSIYFNTTVNAVRQANTVVLNATPANTSTGWILSRVFPVPQGAGQMALGLYAAGPRPELRVRADGSTLSSPLTPESSCNAKGLTGAACQLYRYSLPLLDQLETAEVKITINNYDTVVQGCFGAFL